MKAMRRDSVFCSAVCCTAVLIAAPSSYSAEPASPPSSVREILETRESHAFLAAAHQREPLDLAEHGYVEAEYLVNGEARVLEWPRGSTLQALARGPYTTRILVRRPRNAARFNGTAVVEALNPSSPVDLPIMWAQSHLQLIADGYAWIGVTIKPNTIESLRRFDPARYAALAMPHPDGGPTCAPQAINAWSRPTAPENETGLAWDILSQVGALLKSERRDHPLGRPAERLYMTGQSQTAGYARTYASAFGRIVRDADGAPLYDGYLYSGSPPWQVPVHQCALDLAPDDARLITAAAGVPVIEIFAEGDIGTNVATRRPDSDEAPDLFRRYEIAGAPHGDTWQARWFASEADMLRAIGQPSRTAALCEPREVAPSDFPIRYVLDSAWRNLDAWVREGVPPPRGAPLELAAGAREQFEPERAFATDEHGNAKGGVRTPHVEVPTARWIGAQTGAFQCMFRGYKYPFDAATLARLYPSREDYVAKVRASAEALAAARWITREDAAAIVRDARSQPLAEDSR